MDAGHPWSPVVLLLALVGVAVGLAGGVVIAVHIRHAALYVALLFLFCFTTTTGGHVT